MSEPRPYRQWLATLPKGTELLVELDADGLTLAVRDDGFWGAPVTAAQTVHDHDHGLAHGGPIRCHELNEAARAECERAMSERDLAPLVQLYRDAAAVAAPPDADTFDSTFNYDSYADAESAGFTAGVRAALDALGYPVDQLGETWPYAPAAVMEDHAGPLMDCEACGECVGFPATDDGWLDARRLADEHNARHPHTETTAGGAVGDDE